MIKLLYITFLLILTSITIAQIKYVPTDYEIIQHAINDSKDGDTIIVDPGVYCQQIDFKGKAITVASRYLLDPDTSYISNTIIDGMFLSSEDDSSSLVYFVSGEDSTSELLGFTLQNGKGTYNINDRENWRGGGAVFIEKSGATLSNNTLINNESIIPSEIINYYKELGSGGAINVRELPENRSVIIKENVIKNNKAVGTIAFGGGICVYWSYGTVNIYGNRLIENKAKAKESGYGGGICISAVDENSKIKIHNNYIGENYTYSFYGSSKGGGIACYFAAPVIRNNIIVYNTTEYPILFSNNAFGGGIAVHWYLGAADKYQICNPKILIVNIENNTIVYNNDKYEGGGVALRSVGANLKNNIIGCNFAELNKQIKVEYPDLPETDTRKVIVEYCNIEGGYEGLCNINEFPNFTDEEHWYLQRYQSPCIDSGDPSKDYEDIEDPFISGRACFPALGTKRNDIGAFGGPHSKWQQVAEPTDVEDLFLTEIPDVPYLSQNYPNPFNPSTTIQYSIPSQSVISNPQRGERSQNFGLEISPDGRNDMLKVSLKVYDILGSEIATLVNKNQKPGNYEVVWNASDLPSGVYFYKLSYGAFIETKKLTLLK